MKTKKIIKKGRKKKKKNTSPISCYKLCRIGEKFCTITCKPLKGEKKISFKHVRLPGVEPGSIAWKAIILTVGLQTLNCYGTEQFICSS